MSKRGTIPPTSGGEQLYTLDTDQITVFIFLPIGILKNLKKELPKDLEKKARKKLGKEVKYLIAYYLIIGAGQFPYDLVVRYTPRAWDKATKNASGDYPKLAYLVEKGEGWAQDWIWFVAEVVGFVSPDESGDGYGYVHLHITELADPLIGGCGGGKGRPAGTPLRLQVQFLE